MKILIKLAIGLYVFQALCGIAVGLYVAANVSL